MIARAMEAHDRPKILGDEWLDPEVEEPLPYELVSNVGLTSFLPPSTSCNTHIKKSVLTSKFSRR